MINDKQVLLNVGDGPEGITIYTSEDQGIIDWSPSWPALYIEISINGASSKFGPFTLPAIHNGIKSALNPSKSLD